MDKKWIPWIIVAAVAAVIVIVIAINTGNDGEETAATTTTVSETSTTTGETTTTTPGDTTTSVPDTTTPPTTEAPAAPEITIGSANFTESSLVAEIYAQALESAGFKVNREFNIGSREIYAPALESGELDLVPEYTGSALTFLGGTPTPDSDETYAALQQAWEPKGITVLAYAPAQDKNGFVVTRATADALGVSKLSDLAAHNDTLILGGPPECPERDFCLKGLEDVYGLSFKEFKSLDAGGPLTVEALKGDEIQVGLMFTSDGTIAAEDFVLLEDDKNMQPAENVVPAVRTEVVDAAGSGLVDTLGAVSEKLTTEDLTEMNKQVGFDGEDPEDVAAGWLKKVGITG
jgi:osmoprotectant transport system substrate-binding protein